MVTSRVSWSAFRTALYAFRVIRAQTKPERERRLALLPITLGVMALLMMLLMGWVRESARATQGYLIYDRFQLEDEAVYPPGGGRKSRPRDAR